MSTGQLLKRILKYTKPYRGRMILAIISAIVAIGLSLLTPVLVGDAIDYIIGVDNVAFGAVVKYILILAAVIGVSALFQWSLSSATNSLAFNTALDMRTELFAHINKLPLKYLDGSSHGDLIARVSGDIDMVCDGLLQGFVQAISGIITIAGTVGFMLSINVWMGLIVILLTPLSFFVASFIAKRSHDMFRKQSDKRGEISGYIEEMIGEQRVVQAFGREAESQDDFERINDELYECGVRAQFYSSMTNPCTRFVNNIVYAVVGVAGALFALLMGVMTAGRLSTFLMYSQQFTKPFNEITGVITELQTALASARRIFAVLDEPEESSDEGFEELTQCNGEVTLDNVSFSYTPEKPLIESLSLAVQSGQKIAIVGPTGCGKTTLINLLMRYYDVCGGSIKVSGKEIDKITRKSLRESYGMVLQDTWLFSGSIRDNITYGKRDATDEEVIAAATAANAHSFISHFADGYDTQLAENGDNLSQGQRQLLCIARIMLTRPPMLILDEATSSIDTRTELKIQQAFGVMMEGRTSFIVAHRLSTIKEADVILVMKDGNIIEQGNHNELLAKGGFYADLYNSQFESSAV